MSDNTEWLDEYELPALPARVFGTYNFPVQVGLFLVVMTAVCYMIIMVLGIVRVRPEWERVVLYEQLIMATLGLLFDSMGLIVLSVSSDLPMELLIVSCCTIATQTCIGVLFVVWMYRKVHRFELSNHLHGGVIPQPPRARHNNSPDMPGEHAPAVGLIGTLRRKAGLMRTQPITDLPSATGPLHSPAAPLTRTYSDRAPIVTSLMDDFSVAMGPPNVSVRDLAECGPSGLGRTPSVGKVADRTATSFVSYKADDEYATTVVTV